MPDSFRTPFGTEVKAFDLNEIIPLASNDRSENIYRLHDDDTLGHLERAVHQLRYFLERDNIQTSWTSDHKMDLKEFRDLGLLQEVNRLFFHPLGLELAMGSLADGTPVLLGVLDGRGRPFGYEFERVDDSKVETVSDMRRKFEEARTERYGEGSRGVQKSAKPRTRAKTSA